MRSALSVFWHDVRYAVRGYLRAPLFTTVAIATLTLGVGSTTAMFSVLNAVVLRALPYPDAEALVTINQARRDTGARQSVSPPNYFDLKERTRRLNGLAAYGTTTINVTGAGTDPEKVQAATCSDDLFTVLRTPPALGRAFTADDTIPGAAGVVVISYGLWQRRFAGAADVLNRDLILDNAPMRIVGVMPRQFDFPARGTEVWLPLRLSRTQPPNPGIPAAAYRGYRILSLVGRLGADASIAAARAEAAAIGDALSTTYPDTNRGTTLAVTPLREQVAGSARPVLFGLFMAVACVLLIACANASGLILVRAAARTRELAIRRAIGADGIRLVGQLLTESLVLAVASAGAALIFASWAVDVFVRLAPGGIPRLENVRVDMATAGFALAVATGAGVLFGLFPAIQARRGAEHDALRAGRGTVTTSNRAVRHALVVLQIAISTVLLATAGLLVRSFVKLSGVDTGFRPASAVVVDRIELPRSRAVLARSGPFFDQLLARLRDTPEIEAAGATLGLPLDPRARFYVDESPFAIARRPAPLPAQKPSAALHVVSDGYFAAAGIPLQRGRWFDGHDQASTPAVMVINEAMARLYWPGEDPIGQTVTHDLTILPNQPATRQIVGIVGDVRHFGLESAPEPQMFIPHAQMPWPSMTIVVRTTLPPDRITAIVRGAVRALDAAVPVPPAKPMQQVVADAVGPPRFRAWLVGTFAATALLLAMVGLYGTIAFSVQQRTRELGLRMALGASPDAMMRLVLGSGLKLTVVGAAIGVASALPAARLLATWLFGIGANDPLTFVVVPASLIAAAALACYVPARRVRRIEPLRALADE